MKPYNPIKAEEKIMSEDLTKQEKAFVDSFKLSDKHKEVMENPNVCNKRKHL
jgi:hypothetical protein